MLKGLGVLELGRPGLSIAAGSASPPAVELFPDWSTDGDTISWATNPELFTLTNYTAGTDGGLPCLQLTGTDPFARGFALTNRTDIGHCRVEVVYRAQAASGFSIQNINIGTVARYHDANNYWFQERTFGAGTSWLLPHEYIGGGDLSGDVFGGVTTLDNTDATTHQTLKTDVFSNVIRAKTWFANGSEPDWLGAVRFRPTYGAGGTSGSPTASADNITETGSAGVTALYGATIYDIRVTPLVRSTVNVFENSTLGILTADAAPLPFFWAADSADQTGGNGSHLVTATGPFGDTELVFQAKRLTTGDGPLWTYAMGVTGIPDNVFYTRDRPSPALSSLSFATVRCSVWTKGTNITNSTVTDPLSAIWVTYYIDGANSLLMGTGPGGTEGAYHFKLGPGALTDSGTWGWTLVTYDMPIYSPASIAFFRPQIGLHDPLTTGELLFSRPKMEIIA